MSVMNIDGFNRDNIFSVLKNMGNCPKKLLIVIDFIFSPMIVTLVDELNAEFNSSVGRPAYPRLLLLGVMLYCFALGVDNLVDAERECCNNRFLRVFTRGFEPKVSTFRRFLEDSDNLVIKKIFLGTLVYLNDLRYLDFGKLFIDGTDALVNGSKYFKITLKEIEMLRLMKKWGAIHVNTKGSMDCSRAILMEKRNFYVNDHEMLELIDMALKRIEIYNVRMCKKRSKLKKILLERDVKFVCVMFPTAVMMKTKKGAFDFALNLQEIMTERHIIVYGTLLERPNDHYAIKDLLEDLKETFNILIEMQKKFGQRRNYKEIQKRIDEMILIADSGYFTDENMYALEQNQVKYLIMPKSISQQINNELREENDLELKLGKNEENSKKNFKRVSGGYICPNGEFLNFIEVKDINFTKIDVSNLPFEKIPRRYIFECKTCAGCPNIDKCKHNHIEDRITPLQYNMIEKITKKTYKKIYKLRFSISEGINGFLKNTDGTFKLISPNKKAADNEIMLRNTLYNLIRTVNLKGTAY